MSPVPCPRALPLLLLLLALPLACTSVQAIQVDSHPEGAHVVVDGHDTGLTTPAQLNLSTRRSEYTVGLQKPGYNPATVEVSLDTDVDVMSPGEAFGRVLCAPCCLGLTLPGCLTPVDVDTRFVPGDIHVNLDVAGQGLRLKTDPPDCEVYVNGRLVQPMDQTYVILKPGDHEIEVTRDGHRPFRRVVHIEEQIYQDLDVCLEVEGQGILLDVQPGGAKVFVDDQYQGTLEGGVRRLRLSPGAHDLRVELEGYQAFRDVVTVNSDEYRSMEVTLELAGQGILFERPKGLRKDQGGIEILVDDALQSTDFGEVLRLEAGEHGLEVRVPGYQPWSIRVRIEEGKFLHLSPVLQRPRRDADG